MATIREIADRLGISISTVSKGLNGAADVSIELRQTILDTAVEFCLEESQCSLYWN